MRSKVSEVSEVSILVSEPPSACQVSEVSYPFKDRRLRLDWGFETTKKVVSLEVLDGDENSESGSGLDSRLLTITFFIQQPTPGISLLRHSISPKLLNSPNSGRAFGYLIIRILFRREFHKSYVLQLL